MSKKGRHQSLDKELKRNILALEKLEYVEKVVLGISECCRHKFTPGAIKFKLDVDGGIKVNGYSGKGVTDIFIHVTPEKREELKELILQKYSS